MKYGIQAQLCLPKKCLDIILENRDEVENYFKNFIDLQYDIYEGIYNGIEICGIEFYILNSSKSLVNDDYKKLKYFIKNITDKQPEQIYCVRFTKR